jgi:hypothetical protein
MKLIDYNLSEIKIPEDVINAMSDSDKIATYTDFHIYGNCYIKVVRTKDEKVESAVRINPLSIIATKTKNGNNTSKPQRDKIRLV